MAYNHVFKRILKRIYGTVPKDVSQTVAQNVMGIWRNFGLIFDYVVTR